MRTSGILMHISSLPSSGGIGSMGPEAYAFADFLQASGMRIWQVLPIGPTGYGESPYQSSSVFAGNPLLIACDALREEGLLDYTDDEEFRPEDPETVDEKYYVSDAMLDYFMGVNQRPSKFPRKERFLANINRKNQDIANSVTTNAGQRPTDNFAKAKENWNPTIIEDFYRNRPIREYKDSAPTLRSERSGLKVTEENRIRKLTPKECWRLMGFDDEDVDKAKKVNSNTQLYKQAGNSIVVNVLEAIFSVLLK